MRRIKKRSSLYQYLDISGIFETGTDVEISNLRKQYWQEYKRNWRKQKRKSKKEFAVSFNKEQLNLITEAARKHKMSRTAYIIRATLGYTDNVYLIPNDSEIRRIAQLLAMQYNLLQELSDEHKIPSEIGKEALRKLSELERDILSQLHHPRTLEEWIKEEIRKDTFIKEKILHLLTGFSHDPQKS